ncbi:hypothetical protein JCM14469_25190 [Desulfatiferula olefinivorans]
MGRDKPRQQTGTALIEEAIHLLRRLPKGLLVRYYAGTLPFVTALLFFWGDMSQSALAPGRLSVSALGLALLFVWMKGFQCLFARGLLDHLNDTPPQRGSASAALRHLSFQALVHATAPFLLPLALLITLPYGWVYAFYQSCLVADCPPGKSVTAIVRDTFKTAAREPAQNHMILLYLTLLKLIVLMNAAIAVYALPQLAKRLLGIESAMTLGGFNPLNSTYLMTVLCLTYVCVDPLVKTVYTLRWFHGISAAGGQDLMVGLKRLAIIGLLTIAAAGFGMTALSMPHSALALTEDPIPARIAPPAAVSPEALEEAVHEVLNRRAFAWRMPPADIDENDEPGMLQAFFDWLNPHLTAFFKGIARWVDTIADWLRKLFPPLDGDGSMDTGPSGRSGSLRMVLYALSALFVLFLIVFLFRMVRNRGKKMPGPVATEAQVTVDLNDDSVSADDLPPDSWSRLAHTLMDQGDFRPAMRALYLGTLARLSEQQLLFLARYKSNRDYLDELSRRGHDHPERVHGFADSVSRFEGVWYGMHSVSRDDVLDFARIQERILGHAR